MGLLKKLKLSPAVLLGMVAGVLLVISGVTGVATWSNMGDLAREHIADNDIVEWVFRVLMFLGALGGFLVMAGAFLIGTERIDTGRLLITVGVGTGLIGTIMLFWNWYDEQPEVVTVGFLFGLVGILLSVISRSWAKRVKKQEKENERGD